jgi:hypothetical protein
MNDLRRFQRVTSLVLAGFFLIIAAGFIGSGHPRVIAGLVGGVVLGLTNLFWMVGTARRFIGTLPTTRALQFAAAVRFITVVGLFGAVLVIGRVDPVGAVIGYACFPIAAAVAGWWLFRSSPGVIA